MKRCWKPLSARVTCVLFLSLIRYSFVADSNVIVIAEFIKFLLLSFDHFLPFPFDSDGRCCRCLLCTKVSSSQNFNLVALVVAVFLFNSNPFVIHFYCNRMAKELKLIISYIILETNSRTRVSAILDYIAKIAVY